MIDSTRLATWMDGTDLPGRGEQLDVSVLSGGSQNAVVELTRGQLHGVLRIPPPSAPAERDKGIAREWRILEALEGTDVPHTAPLAMCADSTVLGRPFYLMTYVDGWSLGGEWPAPFNQNHSARCDLAFQMVEGVALLGNVDWQSKGLQGFGRPEGFHERQVQRWTAFLERIKGRELPGFEEAAHWLTRHKPIDFVPGLMHGDYGFANVMFGHGLPSRLAAIVDWEMTTIGDPKLDLGWALSFLPDDPLDPAQTGGVDGNFYGMPTRDSLAGRYADVSGRQVDDLDFYLVLAMWKLAVVLEQSYQRAGDNERLKAFGPMVLDLMKRAADLAESTRYGAHAAERVDASR